MGYYVNPEDGSSKESFLRKHGKLVSKSEAKITEYEFPVVLVDNVFFTAAAIAYDEAELKAFTDPSDLRSKFYFQVPKSVLTEFLPA
jgi:hypothetical protein